jgi:tetratricopeptide (TPR) repeat protein
VRGNTIVCPTCSIKTPADQVNCQNCGALLEQNQQTTRQPAAKPQQAKQPRQIQKPAAKSHQSTQPTGQSKSEKKAPVKPVKKKKGYWASLDRGEIRKLKIYIFSIQIVLLVIFILNAIYESLVIDAEKFYLPLGFYFPLGYLLLLILFLAFILSAEGLWFKYINIKNSRSFTKRSKLIKNYQGTAQKVLVSSIVIIIILLSLSFFPFITDALKLENDFEVSPNGEEDNRFEEQDALGITSANSITVDSNNTIQLEYGKLELNRDLDDGSIEYEDLGNHTNKNVPLSSSEFQLGYTPNKKYYFFIKNIGNNSVSGKYIIEREISKPLIFNIILFMILYLIMSIVWLGYLSVSKKKYEHLHETKVEELTKKYAVKPYAIEDVFLIHKDGTLLTHQTRRLKPMDNDILSAMLTAIKDFINDAFKTDSKGELNELKYGKLNIKIEHGQFIFLAVVISGTPPKNLRIKMKQLLLDINKKFYNQLKVFNGIPKQFEPVKGMIFQNLLASNEEGTHMDEGSDSFWNNKGVVQTKLGKYNEALECFDRALKINPGVSNIWLNRGIALVKLNEFEEAMDCFDRSLQLDPNNESAKRRRNKCWYKWKLLEAREDGITDSVYTSRRRHGPEPGYDYDYYDYGPEPTPGPTPAPATSAVPTPGPGPGIGPSPGYTSSANYQDEAPPRCPDCGQPLRYIDEYESWYCEPCDIYPYDD